MKDNTTINYGAQYENVIAQELNSHGYEELHYYTLFGHYGFYNAPTNLGPEE